MSNIFIKDSDAESITVSPKMRVYDLVCVKVGNTTYLSPQLQVNKTKLKNATTNKMGLHRFEYVESDTWKYNPEDSYYSGLYPTSSNHMLTSNETVTTSWLSSTLGISLVYASSDAVRTGDAFNFYLRNQTVQGGSISLYGELWHERYGEVFAVDVSSDLNILRPKNGVYQSGQLDGQRFAHLLFERIHNRQYQSFEADGVSVNLETVLGDTVEVNGAYCLLADQTITFNNLLKMDLSCPTTTEIHASRSDYAREYAMQITY